MTRTMRAVVVDGPGGPAALRLRAVPVPAPGGGQVCLPGAAFALNWQIINASLSLLKLRGGGGTLASFNSQAHVRLLKAPELLTYR